MKKVFVCFLQQYYLSVFMRMLGIARRKDLIPG